jgi:hypothetical protein
MLSSFVSHTAGMLANRGRSLRDHQHLSQSLDFPPGQRWCRRVMMQEAVTSDARERAVRSAIRELGLTEVALAGSDLEFSVWHATHPRWGAVALRVPARAIDSNPNDPHVVTAELLRHQAEMYRSLRPLGVPVPRVFDILHYDVDVLVCEYVSADGSAYRSAELGEIVARLHALPVPAPAAAGFASTIVERVDRRWGVLRQRAQAAARESLRRIGVVMEHLGLRLYPEKTRILDAHLGKESFDFLGFHHRMRKSWRWRVTGSSAGAPAQIHAAGVASGVAWTRPAGSIRPSLQLGECPVGGPGRRRDARPCPRRVADGVPKRVAPAHAAATAG